MAFTDLHPKSVCATGNVVRLPTAAHRKVVQSSVAVRAYRAAQPRWPGTYELPIARDAKQLAATTKTPELLLVMAMLKVLSDQQLSDVKRTVERVAFFSGDDAARDAVAIVERVANSVKAPSKGHY